MPTSVPPSPPRPNIPWRIVHFHRCFHFLTSRDSLNKQCDWCHKDVCYCNYKNCQIFPPENLFLEGKITREKRSILFVSLDPKTSIYPHISSSEELNQFLLDFVWSEPRRDCPITKIEGSNIYLCDLKVITL